MNDKIEWVLAPREPTEAMWNAGKHFCDGHVTRAIQTYAAMLAVAPKPEAQAAWKVLQIGNYGAAYDPPNARRAFTYEHQPGNVLASRLGGAANDAATAPAGDSIDRGLALLKALQAEGFGVFQVDPAALSTPASHDAQQQALTDVQYPDADSLIAHLAGLCDDGGQGGEWDVAQAAIAGIRAFQQPAVVGEWRATVDRIVPAMDAVPEKDDERCCEWAVWNDRERIRRELIALTPAATPGSGHPMDARYEVPPCLECGAVSAEDAETKCNCSGDKDDCHGCYLWDGAAQKEGNGNG